MKKNILKLVLIIMIFFGISNIIFANLSSVDNVKNISYDGTNLTLYYPSDHSIHYTFDGYSSNINSIECKITKYRSGKKFLCFVLVDNFTKIQDVYITDEGSPHRGGVNSFNGLFYNSTNGDICASYNYSGEHYYYVNSSKIYIDSGGCGDFTDTQLNDNEIYYQDLYASQPSIDNEGIFKQLNNGFTYKDIQASGNGSIKFKIEDLTSSGNIQNIMIPYDLNFPLDVYADNRGFSYKNAPEDTDPITLNDTKLNLKPGHKYKINYEFIPDFTLVNDDGSTNDENDFEHIPSTPQVITTPGLLYYELPFNNDNPSTQEDCQDGTTLKQISVLNDDGTYRQIYACVWPDPDNTIVQTQTTLSGSTINVNVDNKPPVNNITVKNDIKLFSGSSDFSKLSDFSGTGLLDDGFNKVGGYLSKLGQYFSGSFDNLEENFGFSGVEDKNSITKSNSNNRFDMNNNNTCLMFNPDGSFRSYGTLDIGINFNIEQGNYFDFLFTPLQKLINFFTNPINNLLAITSVLEGVEDNKEICYLGFKQKIEYQKFFKISNNGNVVPNMTKSIVNIGDITVIDYFVLILFSFSLLIISFGIFSKMD